MKTVLLLSGGIDSAAVCHWKHPDAALTIDYGQRAASAEVHAAKQVAAALSIDHYVIHANCSEIGIGSMSRSRVIPKKSTRPEWWPYRNQLLLTLAAAWAVQQGIRAIVIGSVRSDRCHRDGTTTFVEAADKLIRLQEGRLRVFAPALKLSSAELVVTSAIPREILAWTHSCHVGDFACGICRGCRKHLAVFHSVKAHENRHR